MQGGCKRRWKAENGGARVAASLGEDARLVEGSKAGRGCKDVREVQVGCKDGREIQKRV